ncbi:MAG: zinc ribbon domain-containing protein [Planctomycetales bacterium]|nr:zinc ribbon domain-containing protein [Planctomycetales bacterium]
MPLYEYACQGCGELVELLIRGDDRPECPQCGGSKLEKQLSVVSAPASSRSSEAQCGPPMPGGCGLPQCGAGRCAGM